MAGEETQEPFVLDLDLFGNGAPSPVRPCCNSVEGEWKVIPHPMIESLEYLGPGGVYTTYYLETIPKGFRVTVRVRVNARVRGTLKCKCMDDGRTLSETPVDEPVPFDTEIIVHDQNVLKKLIPLVGQALMVIDMAMLARRAYDYITMSPELTKMILENAGPVLWRAVQEIINSSNTLCQAKHDQKCPDDAPNKDALVG